MNAMTQTKPRPLDFLSHFHERALERHGIHVDAEETCRILSEIQSGKAEFLMWAEGGFRSFYRIEIYGSKYVVLYDIEGECLVTIYQNSWIQGEPGNYYLRYSIKAKHRRRRSRKHTMLRKHYGF